MEREGNFNTQCSRRRIRRVSTRVLGSAGEPGVTLGNMSEVKITRNFRPIGFREEREREKLKMILRLHIQMARGVLMS